MNKRFSNGTLKSMIVIFVMFTLAFFDLRRMNSYSSRTKEFSPEKSRQKPAGSLQANHQPKVTRPDSSVWKCSLCFLSGGWLSKGQKAWYKRERAGLLEHGR